MANTFRRYRTIEGDRWDTIAFKFRNNPFDYIDIILTNPQYQGEYILPSGVELSIPVKPVKTNTVLPPWKR